MKQRIAGPYKVKKIEGAFVVMRETAQGLQELDPPASYNHRPNAYRRALALNKAWQAKQPAQEQPFDGAQCA